MGFNAIFYAIAIISTLLTSYVDGSGLIDADPAAGLKFLDLDQKYRIYQKRVTWQEAMAFCSKCYGSFATLDDKIDSQILQAHIYNISVFNKDYEAKKEKSEFGLDRRYWIGLTDEKNEGTWMFQKKPTGAGFPAAEIAIELWYPKQPDHGKSGKAEHCGGFWNPGYHIDEFKNGAGAGAQETHSFNDFPCEHKYYFICENTGDAEAKDDPSCKAEAGTNRGAASHVADALGGGGGLNPATGGGAVAPADPLGAEDPLASLGGKRSIAAAAARPKTAAAAAAAAVKVAPKAARAASVTNLAHMTAAATHRKRALQKFPAAAATAPLNSKPKLFKRDEDTKTIAELESNVVTAEDA